MTIISLCGIYVLLNSGANTIIAHGPIQSGHQDIGCADCHVDSPGSARQQIQANIKFVLGQREHPADFGKSPVTAQLCLDCHERPNERHPIYRFNEPRFEEARQTIAANDCLGCHSEHEAARVLPRTTFCSACHAELVVKNDPIDVPHTTLIKQDSWDTCLGCHSFHGNYPRSAQHALEDAFSADAIHAYLRNGPSPYGSEKIYKGKQP
ncbi:MAG: cytochrome c3 family protein [Pseudoruegeria sp.]